MVGIYYKDQKGQEILLQEVEKKDFAYADEYIKETYGIDRSKGYTWHHLDDYNAATNEITMELVLREAHEATYPHSGGCAQYKAATGKAYKS